ncbi:MAG: DNA polymerase III subunit alpha [Chlamydiia bacterium]|nr:DNA polymerase III subunit alpha [Chlamydiia bacterium]MCH9616529.1 DNA polymerase III subunit alpha [Chlamydiia bacterium]MCH9629259.1 DNA polymerase III subunit alpha [Chlamydiia bacterium]
MTWVSLHTHTQFSILDSTIQVGALAKRAKELNMPALAITDFGNLFGAVDFFKACTAEGVKPIIGIELMLAPEGMDVKKRIPGKKNGYPLVLLAKDAKGYKNLCKLSSKAYLEGFYYFPRIDRALLEKHSEGLVCITRLVDDLEWLKPLFREDLYVELLDHTMLDTSEFTRESWLYQRYEEVITKQKEINEALIKTGLPAVITNDVHYLNPDDWKAHEILMNVQSGEPCEIWERDSFGNPKAKVPNPKRKVMASREHYFKSGEEMLALFPGVSDKSLEIAEKCNFKFDFKARHYPVFEPPGEYAPEEREQKSADYLRQLCEEGIPYRYNEERLAKVQEKYPESDPMQVVKDRLAGELEIIITKGMCDYLLIVHDFIAWAKGQGIPVGPGRGSGAGSIILYLIGITDIEPLRFNLFFERFINPERLSYPDIDVDICMDRRQEVIEYTLKKYGHDKVAQIITFGTMKAKMAIKDVGRVMNVPLAKVNGIAKLVPDDLGITLDKALEVDPDLLSAYNSDPETKMLLDFARQVEGSIRNSGVHAAGLIISGDPLTEHIPVCVAKDAEIATTQYSMKPVEAVGMLKIDFLGLKTLTSIQKACEAIEKYRGVHIDWVNLPLEDQKTFELLNHGKTLGIFQLESGGMQDLARQLHIDKFEEIIAVGALYRPGPMEMIPSFINRKHGREKIEVDHPRMKEIIEETYGIMVYQEQVMQIAQHLAGYSLGEGDVLRRAMGKKDKEEMAKQREKFKTGSVANGIDEALSMRVFDKIEKFASYGFNKSHAAAYGFLSYVTAYLKANYPGEWMASLLTCDMDDLTKVAKHIRESQSMGIEILPPDINESGVEFVATKQGIRFALSGIKGVGRGVVETIVHLRDKPYLSLFDFTSRIDTTKVGKKVIESLIDAGCFDTFGWTRSELKMSVDPMFETAQREQKEKKVGIMDFFAEDTSAQFDKPPHVTEEPSKQLLLAKEKELLGFYITGHPMDDYEAIITELNCTPLSNIRELEHGNAARLAFIVEEIKVRFTSKGGRKFAVLTISDGLERFELPVWPSLYDQYLELLDENNLLFAVVQIEKDGDDIKLSPRYISDLTAFGKEEIKAANAAFKLAESDGKKERAIKQKKVDQTFMDLSLSVDANSVRFTNLLKLKELFAKYPGTDRIKIHFKAEENSIGAVEIGSDWGVKMGDELENELKQMAFVQSYAIEEVK